MPSADFAIDTEDLVKVFRGFLRKREVRAVDGISLRVERGATFGFLGPNGAGKTTFVKMLLGSVRPTAGRARLFGRLTHEKESRRPIGYLPENHRFPTYFTGVGMLDLYASLSGMGWRDRKRRIPELLELVGLKDWGHTRLGKYSKGMLQRVGLAQALMHSPELLILDEPSDGVDPLGRKQIREILHELGEKGVTVFINSHLLAEVELFCREVAILHHGKVALTGKIKELTSGKGYKLRAMQVPDALARELTGMAAMSVEPDGALLMQFGDRDTVNAAIDRLRAAGAAIESLTPTTSTLEEVFLRTVQ